MYGAPEEATDAYIPVYIPLKSEGGTVGNHTAWSSNKSVFIAKRSGFHLPLSLSQGLKSLVSGVCRLAERLAES